MKNHIDHFLLGLLWVLAVTLGANFWFAVRFGFNLFYLDHWKYLGQLQASGAAVNSWFYLSMIVAVFIMIFGLYLIMRPRPRRIKIQSAEFRVQSADNTKNGQSAKSLNDNASTEKLHSANCTLQTAAPMAQPAPQLARPPRLVLPKQNTYAPTPSPAFEPASAGAPADRPTPIPPPAAADYSAIEDIFKSAGYRVKNPPKIGSLHPALFAIGPDEVLWLGAVGVAPGDLAEAAEKLRSIFADTLDDIQIDVRPFIINPRSGDADGIKIFDSARALRDYINDNPASEIASGEQEDFDAYSEYIDTVANYFNKL